MEKKEDWRGFDTSVLVWSSIPISQVTTQRLSVSFCGEGEPRLFTNHENMPSSDPNKSHSGQYTVDIATIVGRQSHSRPTLDPVHFCLSHLMNIYLHFPGCAIIDVDQSRTSIRPLLPPRDEPSKQGLY